MYRLPAWERGLSVAVLVECHDDRESISMREDIEGLGEAG